MSNVSQVPSQPKSNSPSSIQASISIHGSNNSDSPPPLPLDPLVNIPQFFNDDVFVNNANIMAHNLNDLLNLRLEEAISFDNETTNLLDNPQFSFLNEPFPIAAPSNLSQQNLNLLNRMDQHRSHIPKIISYNMRELTSIPNVSLEEFHLRDPHNLYLEYFYKDFAWVIFPFQISESNNSVRDILLTLATKNVYLMSAILACGARSVMKLKPSPEHEKAYFSYLSSCLAALSKILNSPKKKLLENVEPLLLTILLLTSDNASSKNQSWRAHLRGAKDLLLIYAQAKREPKTHASSLVFAFCGAWYVTFELLAGSGGLPLGGTIDSEDEMDLLINTEDDEFMYLKSMNLIIGDSFNRFAGYTFSMVYYYRDMIKLMIRDKKEDANRVTIHEAVELLAKLEKETKVSLIHPSAIVPSDHYLYPNSETSPPEGEEPLPVSCIGILNNDDGSIKKVYSWYDISQQSAALGCMLVVFNRILKLPQESSFIKELVTQIITLMHFLDCDDPPKVYHIMMLQPTMWEAGSICTNPEERKQFEKFFVLLKDVGVGSAEYVLKRIRKKWALYDRQKIGSYLSESNDDDEELDIVTY